MVVVGTIRGLFVDDSTHACQLKSCFDRAEVTIMGVPRNPLPVHFAMLRNADEFDPLPRNGSLRVSESVLHNSFYPHPAHGTFCSDGSRLVPTRTHHRHHFL